MLEGFLERSVCGLTIYWKLEGPGEGFEVNLAYENTFFIKHLHLGAQNPQFPFTFIPESNERGKIDGKLSYHYEVAHGPYLNLQLTKPTEKKEYLYPDEASAPARTPCPEGNLKPDLSFRYRNLFPYVYIRPWPRMRDEDMRSRFITYEKEGEMCREDATSFYDILVRKKAEGNRAGMEAEAIAFIDGIDSEGMPAYSGCFVSDLMKLKTVLKDCGSFGTWMLGQKKIDFEILSNELKGRFGGWGRIREFLKDPEYGTEKERLWESFFSLIITSGYRQELLERITVTLVTASLLERMYDVYMEAEQPESKQEKYEGPANEQEKYEGADNEQEEYGETNCENENVCKEPDTDSREAENVGKEPSLRPPSPEELYRWVHANILLPEAAFPLPPFQDAEVNRKNEFVKPYSIGELQVVQYSLGRYEPGEISHIENVLKGECKEVTERKLRRLQEDTLEKSVFLEERGDELDHTTTDFLNEVHKTLGDKTSTTEIKSYDTNYGTATDKKVGISGLWNVVDRPAGGYLLDREGFAKDVISHTVDRISKKVNSMRLTGRLSEAEEKVIHRLDNRGGEQNILGIYRWLNKVYSLRTINHGNRLVLEMLVDRPAASYLKNELQYHEIMLEKPVSPEKLGLNVYTDISESERESCYYLDLLAKYEVSEIVAPPPKFKIVTAVLENAKAFSTQSCAIPEGYEAEKAYVSISFEDESSRARVMIGRAESDYSSENNPISLNLEQSLIPVSIMCLGKSWNSGDSGTPSGTADTSDSGKDTTGVQAANHYLANIEIECKRMDVFFKEWQFQTFQRIIQGYEKQKVKYYRQLDEQCKEIISSRSRVNRMVEWQELKRACLRLLQKTHVELVGQNPAWKCKGSGQVIDETSSLRFFEKSLEWDKISYSFYPVFGEGDFPEGTAMDMAFADIHQDLLIPDPDFHNFLRARAARILLPVRPEKTFGILYFLSSGMIWPGTDGLAPATVLHVSLVNEFKTLCESKSESKAVENAWEVSLPTSMSVLQADSSLQESGGDWI